MIVLYPAIEPFASGFFDTQDKLHKIHYEQSGNPTGVPVLFLHGGPGAGSSPQHRRFFDPKHYRIVILDQRGCGKSTPHASLDSNTSDFLIGDIEQLREALRIDSWHVFGGSWGSTLSLAYAIAHPARVKSLTLRGIFLMMKREIDWFLEGARSLFPDAWEDFARPLPLQQRGNILESYYKLLTHDDMRIRIDAAQSWAGYESAICRLFPSQDAVDQGKDPTYALPISRIEAHFFMHDRLKDGRYILDNIDKIRHIPATIVQGRYDAVCPMETAWELHRAWPEASLVIVPDAGHSAFEDSIARELVKAANEFRKII